MTPQQRWRKNNPIRDCYYNLKSNAKRRGKEFDLTFEQFKQFAIKTEYFQNKGRSRESWHIDRIDETKGYTIDNIQVLTNTKNVKKYLKFKERNPDGTVTFEVKNDLKKVQFSGVPF